MKKALGIGILAIILFSFISAEKHSVYTSVDLQESWVAPESAKDIKNPVAEKKRSTSAKKGKKIFDTRCFICHGKSGKGDGAAAARLNPKPANLTSERVQNQVDGEIFWKISNGKGAMPKWEALFSEEERWDLVNYIRTLKAE